MARAHAKALAAADARHGAVIRPPEPPPGGGEGGGGGQPVGAFS